MIRLSARFSTEGDGNTLPNGNFGTSGLFELVAELKTSWKLGAESLLVVDGILYYSSSSSSLV
jgi:hypothetical protein